MLSKVGITSPLIQDLASRGRLIGIVFQGIGIVAGEHSISTGSIYVMLRFSCRAIQIKYSTLYDLEYRISLTNLILDLQSHFHANCCRLYLLMLDFHRSDRLGDVSGSAQDMD
jgi:hypothetical protein